MARIEYKLPGSNIPYNNELRIFVCDTQADAPQAQSIRDNDMFYFKDTKSWGFGSSGAVTACAPYEQLNWEDAYNEYNDTPTLQHKVEQLAWRVQALEDQM